MTHDEWEACCRRCGRCCYEKIEYDGDIYYTDTPCDRLDTDTCLCTVYGDRHRVKPECMQLDRQTLRLGILPADCPYVSGIDDYKAPRLWDDPDS